MTIEYLLGSAIIILLPGTGVLYTLALGLARGWRGSALAALGCTLGIVPHIAASILGLAALLHASALAFQVVKYLGVAYLLYMAWSILRSDGVLTATAQDEAAPAREIVTRGFLINILNPKLSLFFLAFLPQHVPEGMSSPSAYMLGLAAIFMALTFVVFVGYGAGASSTRRFIVARPGLLRWLHRGFAGAFAGLGMRLATSDR